MSEQDVTTVAENLNKYGKLEIELTGDPRKDKVELEGKRLPTQGLFIHSDMDMTSVDIDCVHLPGGEPYKIEGYLISEEQYDWLQDNKPRGL